MNDSKTKKTTDKKSKKSLPLKRVVSNCLFALKTVWEGSPLYLIVYFASSIGYGLLGFLGDAYLLRKIVNAVQAGEDLTGAVRFLIVVAVVSIAFYVAMNYYWNVLSVRPINRITANIEKMLFKKAREVELACYEDPEFYDKNVMAMEQARTRIWKVLNTADNLFNKILNLSANSILLIVSDPVLLLFAFFPFLLGIFRRIENRLNHDLEKARKPVDRRGNYVRRAFYRGEFAKEMRTGSIWRVMLSDLEETYAEYKKIYRTYGFKRAVVSFLQRFGIDGVTIMGATLYSVWSAICVGYQNGGMAIGDCIVVIGSIGTISYTLSNVIQNVAEFGEHAVFLEDVRTFLDYEPRVKGGTLTVPEDGGTLEVRDLSFGYKNTDRDALKNVSFTLKKGEKIALVGANGSGKTTLVKLLLRFYDPGEGGIYLDGVPASEYDLTSWRDSFGAVFQDYKLFAMTVKDNVLLRPEREGDRELVESALKKSGAWEKVESFEKGIDTNLTREFDDKGEVLSGGEAQKIALARIFAREAPFVLLDEPSSALDPIAEYKMFENMMNATEGKSVIFISHRLSSAVLADRVILLDGGEIAETGAHAELMKANGKYAQMFGRQAENYLGKGESVNG